MDGLGKERKGMERGDGSWDVIWVEQIGAAGKQGLMGLGVGFLSFGVSNERGT